MTVAAIALVLAGCNGGQRSAQADFASGYLQIRQQAARICLARGFDPKDRRRFDYCVASTGYAITTANLAGMAQPAPQPTINIPTTRTTTCVGDRLPGTTIINCN